MIFLKANKTRQTIRDAQGGGGGALDGIKQLGVPHLLTVSRAANDSIQSPREADPWRPTRTAQIQVQQMVSQQQTGIA
jgi:hypothetical protein